MLKVGLIGLGKMGRYHLNLYRDIHNVELVGICDTNKDLVDEISSKTGYKGYTDYKELLKHVDAVTIAAPTKFHYEIAKTCLESKKHILVEKPITTNFNEATELFDIAIKNNLTLHIGHVERFNGAVQEIKNLDVKPRYIEARRIGPYNPNFKSDSIVLDLMIHDIDIIMNLMGSKVKAIQAMGSPIYTELADYASVNLMFENNSVAHIYVSRISQTKERVMSLHGQDALIELDFTTQDINIYRQGHSQQVLGDREMRYKNEFVHERLFIYKDNPLKLEINHFINCVTGKVPRIVTVEHDLQSLKVALKIDELIRSSNYGQKEII